jgi:hypothetical protein
VSPCQVLTDYAIRAGFESILYASVTEQTDSHLEARPEQIQNRFRVKQFPTGLAVLIEKKSRRMELALYCFSRAIESFGICVSDTGLLNKHGLKVPNRVDVFLFSIATSIIMHCYAEEREVFRSKYLNVLDWVFGIPDPTKSATPTQVESKGAALDEKLQQNVTPV